MKKTYISPDMMVIESECEEMLALSQDLSDALDYSEGGTLSGVHEDVFVIDESALDW